MAMPGARKDQIETLDQLVAASRRLPLALAESLARKFVAHHRGDERGWRHLIGLAVMTNNDREVRRLALAMHERFPRSEDVVAFTAHMMCRAGDSAGARDLLRPWGASGNPMIRLLSAQLRMIEEPNEAIPLFDALASEFAGALELELGAANARALAAGTGRPVGFYLFYPWHRSIQQPIFEAAMRRPIRCFMTGERWIVRDLAPDVLVVSDTNLERLRDQLPAMRVVHTRHGLGDKNYSFQAASKADAVCVSSSAITEAYVRDGLLDRGRFWLTGYAQLDPLFRTDGLAAKAPEPRTVLLAPTYNDELSAALVLGERAIDWIRGRDLSVRILIRPHPKLMENHRDLIEHWRTQAKRVPNVEIHDHPEADITKLMARAAVMISDVSSIALSYIALDRPILCLDYGSRSAFGPHYAADGVEWRMRAVAEVVPAAGLAAAVAAALSDPQRGSTARQALRDHLFGDTLDGRAGERIVDRIEEMRRHA